MFGTIFLDPATWDMTADASGNIAMAEAPYALAQDVASATRLFKGEQWYDTVPGVPYFEEILGLLPPASLLQQRLVEQALTVPDVQSAQVVLQALENRTVTGQIQFIDSEGMAAGVSFN